MKRGDLVRVAMQGDFGKPRPALVIQSDLFNNIHPSIPLLPLTQHPNLAGTERGIGAPRE